MMRVLAIFRAGGLAAGLAVAVTPLAAQIREVDPSAPETAAARGAADVRTPMPAERVDEPTRRATSAPASATPAPAAVGTANAETATTFKDEEIFGAAEDVFGKGTQGLAKFVEDILKKQGRPTAYIAGRDAGGAVAVGLRYGQGDLFHKVEGQRQVFWSGPSLGFDIGGNGSKVLILVYNLYDSEELFKRFPMVEGNLYAVGGFTASYLRAGDVALVPIRLGVGWRFGASVGYMKFKKKGGINPF